MNGSGHPDEVTAIGYSCEKCSLLVASTREMLGPDVLTVDDRGVY
jgi:hypothetical protein